MSSSRLNPLRLAAPSHSSRRSRPRPRRAQSGWTKNARILAGSVCGSRRSSARAAYWSPPKSVRPLLRLDDVVGSVLDQARVDPEEVPQGARELLRRVIRSAKPENRFADELVQDRDVLRNRLSDFESF